MKIKLGIAVFILTLLAPTSKASVTVPYTFTPGTTIQSSQLNANFGAVASEINTHENAVNPHQTKLQDVLALNNSCGSYAINFNDNQAINMEVENLSADPTPGNKGRIFMNTIDGNIKYDNGVTIVTIAGSGVNNLAAVLNSGNSAGAYNINVNENQLLAARVENLISDPSAGNTGRLFYNTVAQALKVDTGSAIATVGGSQGLSSVLGISNSAGSTNIDFNLNQAKNMVVDKLSSDPGIGTTGRLYYNTTSNIPKFYNGSSWLSVGNTNTLAQTLALGNSAGSSDINFNSHQAQNMVLYNNNGSPGTGTGGFVWYDTGDLHIHHETSGANRILSDTDSSQTLTNKTISGGSNTITNVADSSLSANVDLLNSAQSISAKKTFTSAPQISRIKTASNTLGHLVPDLADDTFALLNAVQILSGKTLAGFTLSGTADFQENQATHFRVENLSSIPGSAGNAGRIIYSSGDGSLHYDDGSFWRTIGINIPPLANVLAIGNSAGSNNIDFNENAALGMRMENLASDPSPGNVGRLFYNTSSSLPKYDDGVAIQSFLVSGVPITVPQGGTGDTSLTLNGILFGNGVAPVGVTAAGAQYQVFQAGAAGVPTVGAVQLDQAAAVSGVLPNANTTATNANTASTIVARDGAGAFSAGAITAQGASSITSTTSPQLTVAYDVTNKATIGVSSTGTSTLTAAGTTPYFNLAGGNVGIGSATPSQVLDVNGTAQVGQLIDTGATASTVPYFDASKQLTSSAVTPTQLSYVDATSSIQTQLNGKQSTTLTNTHILVGNGSNVATDVALSSDATIANTGALTIANSAVTNAKMANMASNTAKANITGGATAPSDVAAVSTATASSFAVRDASADIAFHKVTANSVNTNGSTGVGSLTARNFTDSLGDGFSIQSQNGTKQWDFDVRDAGQLFIYDVSNGQVDFECTSVGCARGSAAPANYGWEVNDSSSVTDQTAIPARPVSAVKNNDPTVNNYSTLAFENSAGTTDAVILGVHKTHASPGTGDIVFLTENAGALSDKMHILANGNVGIGSTTPVQKLDVNGQANVTNFKNAATSAHGALVTDSSNVQASVAPGASGNLLQSNGTDWVSGAVSGLTPFPMTIQRFLSGSGTYNSDYTFTITSGSATVGATYTNNAITFTVYGTVSSATNVVMSGSGVPAASGTLTKASGTGDATLTFSGYSAPSYIKVHVLGGGGGGGSSGSSAGGSIFNGSDSTLSVHSGSAFITAGGGGTGTWANTAGVGGVPSFSSPANAIVSMYGNGGGGSQWTSSSTLVASLAGSYGGPGPWGGSYSQSYAPGGNASASISNSGSGGAGAAGGTANTVIYSGSGGGAGAYIYAQIPYAAQYDYSVGAGGAGQTAGSNGFAGGAGGSGVITVEEYYQ